MPRNRDFEEDDYADRRGRRRPSGRALPLALILTAVAIGLVVVVGLAVAAVFVFRPGRAVPVTATEAIAEDAEPAAGPGPPLVPVPTAGQSVTQLVFGGKENGSTALVAHRQRGVGYEIDVVETASGMARGQVVIDTASIQGVAVSGSGKWLAVIEAAHGDGHRVNVYDIATGKAAGRFAPYPRLGPNGLGVPELIWVSFVGPDRLLTINAGSGFDVWSVPALERIVGRPPRAPHAQPIVEVNGFTHSPTNFAVTPDGKTLALFNGTGLTFFDTRTAEPTGQTEPIIKEGGSANFWAAAIRADGSRFACYAATYGAKADTALMVWEVPSGRKLTTTRPTGNPPAAGMAWYGPDHMLLWQGGLSSADVMSVSTGDIVARVQFRGIGVLATVPPTDGLWGLTPSSRIANQDVPVLIRGASPPAFRPGARLTIDRTGVTAD